MPNGFHSWPEITFPLVCRNGTADIIKKGLSVQSWLAWCGWQSAAFLNKNQLLSRGAWLCFMEPLIHQLVIQPVKGWGGQRLQESVEQQSRVRDGAAEVTETGVCPRPSGIRALTHLARLPRWRICRLLYKSLRAPARRGGFLHRFFCVNKEPSELQTLVSPVFWHHSVLTWRQQAEWQTVNWRGEGQTRGKVWFGQPGRRKNPWRRNRKGNISLTSKYGRAWGQLCGWPLGSGISLSRQSPTNLSFPPTCVWGDPVDRERKPVAGLLQHEPTVGRKGWSRPSSSFSGNKGEDQTKPAPGGS